MKTATIPAAPTPSESAAVLDAIAARTPDTKPRLMAVMGLRGLESAFEFGWVNFWETPLEGGARESMFVAMQAIRDEVRRRVALPGHRYAAQKVAETMLYTMNNRLQALWAGQAGGPQNITSAQALDVAVYMLDTIADGKSFETKEFYEMKAAIGEARTNERQRAEMEAYLERCTASASPEAFAEDTAAAAAPETFAQVLAEAEATSDWVVTRTPTEPVYKCAACDRPEDVCSRNPCPAVQADREA